MPSQVTSRMRSRRNAIAVASIIVCLIAIGRATYVLVEWLWFSSIGYAAVFWTMLDSAGTVLGGVRAIGPLTSPDESHAVVEWAGQPSLPQVRKMISDRLPFGVVEMKSAWVTDDRDRNRQLTTSLARTGCQVLAVLGVQFCMATCAQHVLERWRSSGGVVAPIRSTPYPDERYRTKMMWWDRLTVASHAAPNQTGKIVAELADIRRRLHNTDRHAPVGS